MAILVVGSVAFDSIETPHGKVDHCLGGAATHFALAASYFTDVRVIAVVGEDFLPPPSMLHRPKRSTRRNETDRYIGAYPTSGGPCGRPRPRG